MFENTSCVSLGALFPVVSREQKQPISESMLSMNEVSIVWYLHSSFFERLSEKMDTEKSQELH